MAAKNQYAKQDRLKYIRRETSEVCQECDKGDRCGRSTHQKRVVEQWICEICSKKHISKAGVIRHMQAEHERKRKTYNESAPRIVCQCRKDFLTMYQYYTHAISEPGCRGKEGPKKPQAKDGEEPDRNCK